MEEGGRRVKELREGSTIQTQPDAIGFEYRRRPSNQLESQEKPISARASGRNIALLTQIFTHRVPIWTSDLLNYRLINLCCFVIAGCGYLLQ
jgi:hypothetical protein